MNVLLLLLLQGETGGASRSATDHEKRKWRIVQEFAGYKDDLCGDGERRQKEYMWISHRQLNEESSAAVRQTRQGY